MPARIGDVLPRRFVLSLYFYGAAGFAAISVINAWRGVHGWGVPIVFGGIALVLLIVPNLGRRARESVQVDDTGVAVDTKDGVERVSWAELGRVRILTTQDGPWAEDVYFVLETEDGRGCVVPHEAAVRTQLLEALQSRLPGIRDDKVIEAMGSTSDRSFTIWERHAGN